MVGFSGNIVAIKFLVDSLVPSAARGANVVRGNKTCSTRVQKGSCFKFLRAASHIKQNVALIILTPFFIKIGQKMRRCCPEKPKLDEGGLKITIYVIILVLYPLSPVLKLICMFSRSRNPFCKVLKNRTFVFPENVVLYHIMPRGHFCRCARNCLQFWCFVNAKWKIKPTEGYSEICRNKSSLTPV